MAKQQSEAEKLFQAALRRKNAGGEALRVATPVARAAELDAMIDRVFSKQPAIRAAMQKQLSAGRAAAAATRLQASAAQAVAVAKRIDRDSFTEAVIQALPVAQQVEELAAIGEPPEQPPEPQQEEKTGASGPRILLDYTPPPPHTLTNKAGKYVETFRWFDKAFLVYDPSIPAGDRGSEHDPWFGISGPKFRCFYPNSTADDFEACMTSGSSGRWLHAWGEKSNYVKF